MQDERNLLLSMDLKVALKLPLERADDGLAFALDHICFQLNLLMDLCSFRFVQRYRGEPVASCCHEYGFLVLAMTAFAGISTSPRLWLCVLSLPCAL